MKVIICGAGQVGWQIARHLSRESDDVTVVDNNADLVRRATETLDVSGISGFASYPDVLQSAGARDADMVIAATHSDEVNMVTCQVAHSVFNVPRKIARLRAQSYLDAIYSDLYRRDHMPIDVVISPEREVADAAMRHLQVPEAFDTENFLDGQGKLIGLDISDNCPVVHTPLRQLSDLFSTLKAMVVGIRREGQLFVPGAADQIFPGDQIYVFTESSDVARTLEIFGKETHRQERVVILGGGNVGLLVAERLEQQRDRVRARVIERSRDRAEIAADALERTIVLNGDGLDPQLLEEARISDADAILCVTDDDKTNLLAGVRGKQLGCRTAICLANDASLGALMSPLGINAYINPRATTVSSILQHVRLGRIQAVYSIGDAEAEVLQAQVLGTSPLAGSTIRDLDFPEGAVIAGVRKGGKLVKPHGALRIEEGDTLVIFALAADVPSVESLLQVSIDFF